MSAFEKNKFVDAIKDQLPAEPDLQGVPADPAGPAEPTGPGSTPEEIAEKARRDEEAKLDGRSRDDRLINMGRGRQTTGR